MTKLHHLFDPLEKYIYEVKSKLENLRVNALTSPAKPVRSGRGVGVN